MSPSALPVLYSFRRCPYAMRARLALTSSGIACELREIVLRDKPASLRSASPKATVPVLVLPSGQRWLLTNAMASLVEAIALCAPAIAGGHRVIVKRS